MSKTLFDSVVIKKQDEHGFWHFECPKGLWGAGSFSHNEAEREASMYFWQYMEDGEYDDLLTN